MRKESISRIIKLYLMPLGVLVAGFIVYVLFVSILSDGGGGKIFNKEFFAKHFSSTENREIPSKPSVTNVIETAKVSLKENSYEPPIILPRKPEQEIQINDAAPTNLIVPALKNTTLPTQPNVESNAPTLTPAQPNVTTESNAPKPIELSTQPTESDSQPNVATESNTTEKRAFIDNVSQEIIDTETSQPITPANTDTTSTNHVVIVNILNIRSEPNLESEVLARVPFGMELEIVEMVDGTWAKIHGKTIQEGYVVRKMIQSKTDFDNKPLEHPIKIQ